MTTRATRSSSFHLEITDDELAGVKQPDLFLSVPPLGETRQMTISISGERYAQTKIDERGINELYTWLKDIGARRLEAHELSND